MHSIFVADRAAVALNLQRIADAVSEAPDFDTRKVKSAREALDRGVYEVNIERIAEKLIQFGTTLRDSGRLRHG